MILVLLGVGVFYLVVQKTGASVVTSGFDDLYKKWGTIYGVDWKRLKAIAIIESRDGKEKSVLAGFANPKDIEKSKSSDGLSWGLMQVQVSTAQDYDTSATAEKLNNADYSVKIAAQHISRLQTVFDSKDPRYTEWVVKSYNQGEGNTLKEKHGKILGYANGYWIKYRNAYNSINGI